MDAGPRPAGGPVRGAEIVATLCLATDLGMGLPFEHGLHRTIVAMRLADRLGADRATAADVYHAGLLAHAGCTADAHVTALVFRDSLTTHLNPVMFGSSREILAGLVAALPERDRAGPVRALQVVRGIPRMARAQRPHLTAMCEVAGMLADGVGMPPSVAGLLAHLTERWDGRGPLRRARGETIPAAMRIVHVAIDATFQRMIGGAERAVRLVRERAGGAFDPEVADCLATHADEILAVDDAASAWDEALAREPGPPLTLEREGVDRALATIGRFADLVSPSFAGHSSGVADLAAAAAARCGLDAGATLALRRAAHVHDIGRVAVGARVWGKPGPLDAGEREAVRLHPYHAERVLSRSPFLAALAPVAGAHHERLDASGYHRGAAAADLSPPARLLAAADAFHAMCEPRPHRAAFAPAAAAEELARQAGRGCLDPDAATAVIEAAGRPAPRLGRPAGLTPREEEVVRMLARGLQTKQVARALGISAKTADRHVQNAYRKMGVSTRAAATVFAMEHGLAAWGESPIDPDPRRA